MGGSGHPPSPPAPPAAPAAAAAVLAAALAILPGLGRAPFDDPGEGMHAEIGRELALARDPFALTLSGVRYVDKPPPLPRRRGRDRRARRAPARPPRRPARGARAGDEPGLLRVRPLRAARVAVRRRARVGL